MRTSPVGPTTVTDVTMDSACNSQMLTVVLAAEGSDVARAADRIASTFRDKGYRVAVEKPRTVVGNWIGTHVVWGDLNIFLGGDARVALERSSRGCDDLACEHTLTNALRSVGFQPAESSSDRDRAAANCKFSIYVGESPYSEGTFFLY